MGSVAASGVGDSARPASPLIEMRVTLLTYSSAWQTASSEICRPAVGDGDTGTPWSADYMERGSCGRRSLESRSASTGRTRRAPEAIQGEDAMSMADRDGFIWYDGKLVPWREANTHVLTHSLHYGLAVFEGVRAYKTPAGTGIFRLKEHTERLFNSAKIFMMEIPFTQDQLCEAQREVVRANK